MTVAQATDDVVEVEYCGEHHRADPDRPFVIGREGDLQVDDNPYLHRHFLQVERSGGLWWLHNVGSVLSATVSDPGGSVQAFLAPGARLPLVLPEVVVLFTAGPTTYELHVLSSQPAYTAPGSTVPVDGETTIGPASFTPSQKLLLVALAEPLLRRTGTGSSAVPPSAEAAARLGWPITTFNRKLDNVCDKLTRTGVRGLRGGEGRLASNRRARLVEHAVTARLVTREDLELLPPRGTAAAVVPGSAGTPA